MRNFVVKHDHNKASTHKDLKNDYDRHNRDSEIEEELSYIYINEEDEAYAIPVNNNSK